MAKGAHDDLLINYYRAELVLSKHGKNVLFVNLITHWIPSAIFSLSSGQNEDKDLTVVSV